MEKPSPNDGLQALVDFIVDAFDDTDLKKFVRKLPDGSALIHKLPRPPASAEAVADELVHLLHRRRILDRQFFVALTRERSRRADEIRLIERSYLPEAQPKQLPDGGHRLCSGRYRLEQRIYTGGFGALWRAWDTVDDRAVAIKLLLRDVPENEYAWRRAMFIRGASRMAKIVHPHVARVILPHMSEDGHDFCVLEYIAGRSLSVEIKSGRLTAMTDVLRVLLDVGTGLAEVHTTGALHGDVSPKNIVVYLKDGALHASLVDFDFVCAMDDDLVTVVGTGMPGTDPYAAPEWKAHDGKLDGRVDVFGLGMTAVFALTRATPPASLNDPRLPNDGAYIERALGKFSLDLREVVRKACELKPEARHATMAEFCAELERAGAPRSRAATAIVAPEPPVVARRAPAPTAVVAPEPAPPPATEPLPPLAVDLPPVSLGESVVQAPALASEPPVMTHVVTVSAPASPAKPVRGPTVRWRLVALVSAGLCIIPLVLVMANSGRSDASGEQQAAVTPDPMPTPARVTPAPATRDEQAAVVPDPKPTPAPETPEPATRHKQATTAPEPTPAPVTPEPAAPQPVSVVTPVPARATAKRAVGGGGRTGAKADAPRPAPAPDLPPPRPPLTPPKPSLTCKELRDKVLDVIAQECRAQIATRVDYGERATEGLTCPYRHDANIGVTVGPCRGKDSNENIVQNCVESHKWKTINTNVSQLLSCPNPVTFMVTKDGELR